MSYTDEQRAKYYLQRNQMVVKSNDLIQKTRFSLTTEQQKLVLYLISKIKPTDENFQEYEIKILDYLVLTGIEKNGKSYQSIKDSIKALADKSTWVETENRGEVLIRWLQKVRIDKEQGTIFVRIDEDLKPYLLQIKENYTQYELVFTMMLKSKYSIRAYEYFISKHFNKLVPYSFKVDIEEFKKRVGAERYNNYKDLNTRVIKPIIYELNEYTDKNISIEPIKEGRKTKYLNVKIETKEILETLNLRVKIEHSLTGGQLSFFSDIDEG